MDERAPRDRRIGERVSIEPVEVTWLTTDVVAPGRLRRAKPTTVEHPGRIVNLSATGAGIEGPRHPQLRVGAKATLLYEGALSFVWIRRVTDAADPEALYYGVELEEMHPTLREAVFSIVGKGRPGEESWRRAW
jgi:hypothetical protein